ncbi:hypothetical protein SeMB42_g05735 [Synchytrium endobioticum]|uniref:Peptidase A2 domain-containing protein n=1 Tax=Synchytrium endobioticum TaxID=286115 RepID=A0A507CPM9_9FUNG|nr:hypothetical protein SeMB42_g05735 [Synchytrium endobioticum]
MARVFLENDAVDVRLQEQEIRELQDEWETATARSITNPKDQAEVAQKANDVAAAKQALNDARRDLRQFMRDAADRYVKASQAQPSIPIVTPSSGISSSKVPPFLNVQQPSSMKIAEPDKFSGDMSDYRRWKFEIQNVIAVRTNIDTDDRKIRYFGSRMEGAGLQWYEMYSRKRVQLLAEPNPDGMEQTRRKDEYQDFLNRLDNTFQDPLEQQTYRRLIVRGQALVDSGATRSFIGQRFATKHKIPTTLIEKPQKLILADGRACSSVTRKTERMILQIGKHTEGIALAVFDTKHYDMILGLDWLTFHNPTIDWETRQIQFDSYGCKHPNGSHQMPSAVMNVVAFSREEVTQSLPVKPLSF